jgi:hypothetical protein
MMTFFKQSEGVPMQTINLKQYYPFCKEDIFVEVSDEIVEAFLLDKRAEAARDRKMFRYKAFYSLDCNDGIENAAIGWAQPSPEDYLIEKEELAEYEELIRRLYEAISSLPPMQARRVHARYMLGMKVKDIAAMEGITPAQAGKSIHAALDRNGRSIYEYFQRKEVPDMNEKITAHPQKEEREKVLKEIRQLENRKKILENKQHNEERKARTRRLIERGAILEGIFPLASNLSGAEVKAFLIALSHLPGAAELTANLSQSGDTP